MKNYKIFYKKGEYSVKCLNTKDGSINYVLRTNSIDSLDMLVRETPTIEFELTKEVPFDIQEMLLKYENVRWKNFG